MVKELLSRVLQFNRHIVLFFIISISSTTVFAQTLLLPGDVLLVSINEADNSVDVLPLVDLEPGTQFWLSDSYQSNSPISDATRITLKEKTPAGEIIRFDETFAANYQQNGELSLQESRLYIYQKDENVNRFISGVNWGPKVHEEADFIPEYAFTELPEKQFHQYHLKNGASGTIEMLQQLVTDPANWKSGSDKPFPKFSTSFRLMDAPVVMFDRNLDFVKEGDSLEINVAIFGHDGSRLSVDVVYNPVISTADSSDIENFRRHQFNFTGLIGDAVYAVKIPVPADLKYEGSETLIFELQNMSSGNLGDFVTQAVFINDIDKPSVVIRKVELNDNPDKTVIDIQNLEEAFIDLEGWKLQANNITYKFTEGDYLDSKGRKSVSGFSVVPKKESVGNRIILFDEKGNIVSNLNAEMKNFAISEEVRSLKSTVGNLSVTNLTTGVSPTVSEIRTTNEAVHKPEISVTAPGWYQIEESVTDAGFKAASEFYFWNEQHQRFESVTESESPLPEIIPVFYYQEKADTTYLNTEALTDSTLTSDEIIPDTEWKFQLSATDANENGVIDGAEGLNLIKNNFSDSISVNQLTRAINDFTGFTVVKPLVYKARFDGDLFENLVILENQSIIESGAYFWIQVDSLLEPIEVMLEQSMLPQRTLFTEDLNEEIPSVIIELNGQFGTHQAKIHLITEDISRIPGEKLELPLVHKIRSQSENWFSMGLNNGNNWFKELNADLSSSEKFVFPVGFHTRFDGEFQFLIKDISGLPAGWNVFIEDMKTEEVHEVYSGWDVVFEHLKSTDNRAIDESDNEIPVFDTEEINQRFRVIFTPPGYSESEEKVVDDFRLDQNYPNPFNPTTTIAIYLSESLPVKLSVFNIVGQPVAVLTEGVLPAGDHEFEWDATGLPSGMYIYQMEVGAKILTRKMTLVK